MQGQGIKNLSCRLPDLTADLTAHGQLRQLEITDTYEVEARRAAVGRRQPDLLVGGLLVDDVGAVARDEGRQNAAGQRHVGFGQASVAFQQLLKIDS